MSVTGGGFNPKNFKPYSYGGLIPNYDYRGDLLTDGDSDDIIKIEGSVLVTQKIFEGTVVFEITSADDVNLSTDEVLGGIIRRDTLATTSTDTTPSAAEFLAAIPVAEIGTSFEFDITNIGAGTVILAGGSGVTMEGTTSIIAAETRRFKLVFDTVGDTPTITIYSLLNNGAGGGGAGNPGGANLTIQYNNNNFFGGIPTFTTDGIDLTLSGGNFNLANNDEIRVGTSAMVLSFDGTDSALNTLTGDLVSDVAGSTVMRVGSTDATTSFQVQDNSETVLMEVEGSGLTTFPNTTDSSSSATGAVVLSGGMGVAQNLHCGGSVFATSFLTTSDALMKRNLQAISNPLDRIDRLQPIEFSYNHFDDDRRRYGVIAQQVQEAGFSDMVYETPQGLKVDYLNLIGLMLAGMKEMNTEIKKLKRFK